ncbi:protein RRP6-like 2 isoform X2 [Ricinus communis]|uniref:protein RRP6-like 2 isoform X2 n=1 Tax=Ricinus communis TaxID=3988 RepID=UPI00201AC097|nr:protein RRP6-like 2 isoform X2 [Ricinus communis]
MSQDAMNIDQTAIQTQSKSQTTTGSLSSSLSNLSGSSRTIPSNKDFHFYYNFDEFKLPIQQIARRSQSLLESIGSSNNGLFKDKNLPYPNDPDNDDDTYDWLVNVNDEILERFDASIDEFKSIQKKQEEKGGVLGTENENSESGFQLVYGKKKKGLVSSVSGSPSGGSVSESGVKVADLKAKGVKAKVPFHIPTIKKPQEEYNILVNNSNQPFEHVWLQRSEDGLRFIHPLEKLSILDFVDKSIGNAEPVSPPSLECTPFKLVKEVKDLKELAAKLRAVNEFAVDLEHNQYRSFQGLTCLMQISTRTEDFIIDTLKLRIHVGPYLREVFKDPTKRKVMHGADRDIIWLQRDFGIYVCNLFDTGQASRVLKLERNSLEHLLRHFCGITANKEYQNADWRLRPLTDEMLRYGREDTHYLLYIYDLMRIMLLSMPNETENSNSPLAEVYKRSYDVCMQLYEKELLTESSYLHIYGLQTAGFNAQQLAIVAGLCEWRDVIARTEDESTGFILPNKTLLEIAKQMPVTPQKLRRALKSKHPYIERNLGSVVNVVRHAMQNAAEFEAAAQRLKEGCIETDNVEVNDDMDMDTNLETAEAGTETICDGSAVEGSENALQTDSPQLKKEPLKAALAIDGQEHASKYGENGVGSSHYIPELRRDSLPICPSASGTGATVQVLKKPAGAFGALLGKSSAGKRRFDMAKKDKDEIKLDKIRSSVSLPFHSFLGRKEPAKPAAEEPNLVTETPRPEESFAVPATGSSLEDIILLGDNSDVVVQENVDSDTKDVSKSVGCESETDEEGEPASLSDLSTSFQKCFQSNNENKTNENNMQKSQDPTGLLQLKPFDYAAARKEVIFGEESKAASGGKDQSRNDGVKDRRKNSVGGGVEKDDGTRDFPQGKRRQAFPATGNRSATFR